MSAHYQTSLYPNLMEGLDDTGHLLLTPAIEKVMTFTDGMRLGIKGENFEGVVANYCSSTDTRVTVLLTLLNRRVKLKLPIEAVYPLTDCEG